MKWLLKKLLPSPESISDMAAKAFRDTVNSLPEEQSAKIAKSSEIALQANKVVESVSKWLADGKMDDDEQARLSRALLPLVKGIMERI